MSLNSEWFQSYDKTIANISISLFIRFCTKNRLSQFLYFYVLCHYFCTNQDLEAPQNDHLNLRFVNDKHVVCKKCTDMVVKWLFITSYFLGVQPKLHAASGHNF